MSDQDVDFIRNVAPNKAVPLGWVLEGSLRIVLRVR